MVMENTYRTSVARYEMNLHAAPPQLLKASVVKNCGTSAFIPDALRSTNNILNLSLRHTN